MFQQVSKVAYLRPCPLADISVFLKSVCKTIWLHCKRININTCTTFHLYYYKYDDRIISDMTTHKIYYRFQIREPVIFRLKRLIWYCFLYDNLIIHYWNSKILYVWCRLFQQRRYKTNFYVVWLSQFIIIVHHLYYSYLIVIVEG